MATGLKKRKREEAVVQLIKKLPDEKVVEVIDFIEFLKQKDKGALETEFLRLTERARKRFKQRGLQRKDVREAVEWARG